MAEIREPKRKESACRRSGSLGGLTTASKYPPEVRAEWGRRGGLKTQERYSNDYFKHIRSLREKY